MKAVVAAFNQEKALVGAFSVIVQPVVEPMDRYAALHKVNILWSFLKSHRRKKIVVFLSSCKQTKYFSEVFSKLKPGMSVLGLYGTLHQLRRMAIYDNFCAKDSAVLFATDIAARGLDFPGVDWVVQLDCPEDATTCKLLTIESNKSDKNITIVQTHTALAAPRVTRPGARRCWWCPARRRPPW